ncbi:MAG: hypothetical protein ABSD48_18590 [Armatimonadota bacterium]|jgi:hypothetical protein
MPAATTIYVQKANEIGDGMLRGATGVQLIRPKAPHLGQQEFLDSNHKRRLIVAHRRWGKDWVCCMEIIKRCREWADQEHRRQLSPPISIGIVYPTHPLAGEFWGVLKAMMPAEMVAHLWEGIPRKMTLKSGAQIEVRTGSEPTMLVAAGYDLLVLGEAARLPYEAWVQCLPMIASPGRGPDPPDPETGLTSGGMAVLQSTPNGRNWFHREKESGHWQVWHIPYYDPVTGEIHAKANPHVNPAEVENQRRQMPERWFQQEWLADFAMGEGSVFRNVRERLAPSPYPYAPPLVAGVDLAKLSDWTAFAIFDAQGHMCFIERMQRVNYDVQAERFVSLLAKWHVRTCVIESNGPGEAVYDMVMRDMHQRRAEFNNAPCDIIACPTTAQSKGQMINALVIAFERNEITILPDEDLINEFESYQMATTQAGNIRFGAAEGAFDDRVMACALAWTHMRVEKQRSEQYWPTLEDAIRMEATQSKIPGSGYGKEYGGRETWWGENDPNRTY